MRDQMSRKNVHFIGAGGVGMAALAFLAKARGDAVSGCDAYASSRTRWLGANGIPVAIGHKPSHVDDADEIIVTPAVSPANSEYLAAKAREALGLARVRYRGEVLAEIVSGRESIAVCGSHGKTTTSTFIARLLAALGEKVVWAIGGETGDFPVAGSANCEPGEGVLVVEADESDGTLALYRAATLVVTNCEYDHPDHFKTFEDYLACYEKAKSRAGEVIEAEELDLDSFVSREEFSFLLALPLHNRKNARVAIEIALRRGYGAEAIARELSGIVCDLPDRRFQRIWPVKESDNISNGEVIVDYAHHPTEMKCAVEMARRITKGRLRVLFQPHRYSRTKALLDDFAPSMALADEIVLCPTYAAFEEPREGGDIADLYLSCRETLSGRVYLARSCAEAWRHAYLESAQGDVTLLLGAGDIIKLVPRAVDDCAMTKSAGERKDLSKFSFFRTGGVSVGGGETFVAGSGSNLWISDLTCDTEFRRLEASSGKIAVSEDSFTVSAGVLGASLSIPWMAGIPGTVGGWVKMNAGAFGHSISEVVRRVKVDGVWIERDGCRFGYRHSDILGTIEEVEFESVEFDGSTEDYLCRRKKFPPRTCGSVFKNPPGDFAGRLLEEAGAKSLRAGGAYVWCEHANVIVAGEGSTSSDILALARLMRERVRYRFGIELEPEIVGLSF